MEATIDQHQIEIERNRRFWKDKPLLQAIYAGFYRRIVALVDDTLPGAIVEIGSGIGNLTAHLPRAIRTDLFPNPWLDLACDGYELPFKTGSLSHLILFDVFHHLEAPRAFLMEAHRVLGKHGRLILFEPYISWASFAVYGLCHAEPVAWRRPISSHEALPRPRHYYAAQGNATRLFFKNTTEDWCAGWSRLHASIVVSFSYLLSGGFTRPALYPETWRRQLEGFDTFLSRWPRVFGARCLIGLERAGLFT
jgi:SAM-dependent methyltransferase